MSAPFKPTSVKRPQWVLLGFGDALRKPGVVQRHRVMDRRLVTFVDPSTRELSIADEACPHRGASLADGTVRGGCLVCPYHGLEVSARTHPHVFYDNAVLQKRQLVWVDVASLQVTQHAMPPYFVEFNSAALDVVDYAVAAAPANALPAMEALIDWAHLATPRLPTPRLSEVLVRAYPNALARHVYALPAGELVLENEFHVPFTASLRATLDGRVLLLAAVSLTPRSREETGVHVRVARAQVVSPAAAEVLDLLDETRWQDAARVVQGVHARAWVRSRLGAGDGLIGAYRRAMTSLYPDMLAYFT